MDAYHKWSHHDQSVPQAAVSFFQRNGYVVLTSFCTHEQIADLRAEAAKIVQQFHQTPDTQTAIFTTKQQDRIVDDYFLSSAANVRCFLEEKQPSDSPKAVNKIGHALHDLNATFGAFSRLPSTRVVARALGLQHPLLVQSMYILKNARVGGEVRAHRDATFVIADPPGTRHCLGYWWALQDATLQNGCLYVVPGSHVDGVALREMVRERDQTRVVGDDSECMYDEAQFVPLVVAAGDLVLLHGGVVHKSGENLSDQSRHAYSMHVVETAVASRCWLQRPAELPFLPL